MKKLQSSKVINYLNLILMGDDESRKLSRSDVMWNGVQVDPPEEIESVLFAVSAGNFITEAAEREGCELIFTHHGIFWKNVDPRLPHVREQVSNLVSRKIGLYSCHLPLDKHPVVGNNVSIAKKLDARILVEIANVGYLTKLKTPMDEGRLYDTLEELFGEVWGHISCPRDISTIAIISGAGGYPAFYEALEWGADMLITGDSFECKHLSQDTKMSVAFCGHHETEWYGIESLMNMVGEKFPRLNVKMTPV
jgi:dinuclear metal center YbgI/SA1388 family protein